MHVSRCQRWIQRGDPQLDALSLIHKYTRAYIHIHTSTYRINRSRRTLIHTHTHTHTRIHTITELLVVDALGLPSDPVPGELLEAPIPVQRGPVLKRQKLDGI